jgi:hypothetical protein
LRFLRVSGQVQHVTSGHLLADAGSGQRSFLQTGSGRKSAEVNVSGFDLTKSFEICLKIAMNNFAEEQFPNENFFIYKSNYF